MLYLLVGNVEYAIHGLNVKEGRYSTKGEVFKCYVYLFHYLGHNSINVCNCNRIIVAMPLANCMNENLLEIISCLWNEP